MRDIKQRKTLSVLEHVVMDFLWSHGPASSEQVRAGLSARRPMKDPTVRTILRRLEQKGYATHRVDGRTYIYTCAERPQNVAARAVRQIIDRFCGGSVEQLLVGMGYPILACSWWRNSRMFRSARCAWHLSRLP
jgi:predicted transcriptional regulator